MIICHTIILGRKIIWKIPAILVNNRDRPDSQVFRLIFLRRICSDSAVCSADPDGSACSADSAADFGSAGDSGSADFDSADSAAGSVWTC